MQPMCGLNNLDGMMGIIFLPSHRVSDLSVCVEEGILGPCGKIRPVAIP